MGGPAVAASRLMESLKNNGIKAKMLVRDKQTDQISVVGLNRSWLQVWKFMWERLVIWSANRFHRNHMFDVDIANTGTDITSLPEFRQADVIHLHWVNQGMLSLKDIRKILSSGKPVVWTMHDCWAYTGHCVYYTSVNCEKWKTECSHCPVSTSYPQSVLCDRSKHNFRNKNEAFTSLDRKKLVIVPVSKWLADEVEGSFLKKYPIVPIYNGVNTDVFVHSSINKKKYGVDGKFMILGVATQWTERKGIQDFIKLSKFISEDVAIVLVGLTHKQIVGLPSSIIGISKTDNVQQMVELYSSADLYISFSMEETFGLTIAESLSCGTPALVYNTTATPEIVSEETGFIVTPGDFNAVIDVINTVKLHGKTNYSEKCHQRALTFFSKKSKSSDYISLYKSLLGI